MSELSKIFSGLPASARALLPFFQQQAATDKTASQILAELKAEGRGIRRQTGLDIIGALRNQFAAGREGRLVDNQTILNPAHFPVSITDTRNDFSHRVIVRYTNRVTGEVRNQEVTVATDLLLNKEQITGKALYMVQLKRGPSGQSDEEEIDSIDYADSLRNPNLGE